MGQDPSGTTYRRPIMPIFTPLVAPFTLWSVMLEGTDQWGDGSIFLGFDGLVFLGLTIQCSWGWRFLKRTTRTTTSLDRLSSIHEAQHMSLYDWMFSRIEAPLRLQCTSYIYIYIYHTSPLSFLYFSTKSYCQSAVVNLVRQRSVQLLYPSLIQPSPFTYSQTWWVFSFHKSCNYTFYFPRPFLHTRHHF